MMENKKKAIYTFIGIILAIALTSLGMKYLGSKHLDGTRLITDSIPTPLQQHIAKDTLRHDSVKPHVDSTYYIKGSVKDTAGMAMPGVVVSDGYSCVKTNQKGEYAFKRHKKAKFIYYTVPADCEVPTHSATDNTAYFYQRTSTQKRVYNFVLKRLPGGKETNYRMIVIGDPQVTNAYSPYYTDASDNPIQKSDVQRFTEETMVDIKNTISKLPEGTPVYGISMGDDVQYYGGYNSKLERQIREALGSSRMKVFSVIGNHDQDGKELYKNKWEESWGPTDYSFDRGDVHYVCFNNVHFVKGSYYQPGELSLSQMNWLRQDLKLVPKNKKVILNYHIPFTFGNRPKNKRTPLNIPTEKGHYYSSKLIEILHLLAPFRGGYELFCGHTHFAVNHEINYHGLNILEHCHAAACGNIWQSNVNILGEPNGYYVYNFSSTDILNCYYKSTFMDANIQMTLFRSDTDFNGEKYQNDWTMPQDSSVLIANVFNADSKWRIVAIENGQEYPMTRLSGLGQDAFAAGYHHKYAQSVSYWFVSKNNGFLIMNHLYYYVPKNKNTEIIVKAYDRYGNIYTCSSKQVITEPYKNYAHYYNASDILKTKIETALYEKKANEKATDNKTSNSKDSLMKNNGSKDSSKIRNANKNTTRVRKSSKDSSRVK